MILYFQDIMQEDVKCYLAAFFRPWRHPPIADYFLPKKVKKFSGTPSLYGKSATLILEKFLTSARNDIFVSNKKGKKWN